MFLQCRSFNNSPKFPTGWGERTMCSTQGSLLTMAFGRSVPGSRLEPVVLHQAQPVYNHVEWDDSYRRSLTYLKRLWRSFNRRIYTFRFSALFLALLRLLTFLLHGLQHKFLTAASAALGSTKVSQVRASEVGQATLRLSWRCLRIVRGTLHGFRSESCRGYGV